MFAKIFSQIYDSSIVENPETRFTFMDFLVLADLNGVVDMTHEAISRRTNRPIEIIRATIAELEGPDTRSRTPDNEGRRIVRLDDHRDWGWMIVNYQQFRLIASEEQRREKGRERTARFREMGGGEPSRWPAIRARILKLDNWICGYCGEKANEVDHIIPQSRGGDESDSNLTACCRTCNVTKNNRTPEEAGFTLKNHRVTLIAPCNAMQKQKQKQKQKEEGVESPTAPDAPLPPSSGLKEVFDAWNANPLFPGCLVLSDKRRRFLKVRLHDAFFEANWKAALAKLAASKFCLGNNDRGWRANFDWFIQPDSVAKIMEGKYENNGSTRSNGFGNSANRNTGTLNEGKASQYRGVGKVV